MGKYISIAKTKFKGFLGHQQYRALGLGKETRLESAVMG